MCILQQTGEFVGGISACAFSEDGKKFAVIAGDIYNTMHVFGSASGRWDDAVTVFSGDSNPILNPYPYPNH